MWRSRILEVLSMMIIGDAVLGLLWPRRHVLLWRDGPSFWQRICDYSAERPGMTRTIGAAGVIAGLALAFRQENAARSDIRYFAAKDQAIDNARRFARRGRRLIQEAF